jgi:hypothetical protein
LFFEKDGAAMTFFTKTKDFLKKVRKRVLFFDVFLATNRFYAYISVSTQGAALLNFFV